MPDRITYSTSALDDIIDLGRLAASEVSVARLSRSARESRVKELTDESHMILTAAIDRMVTGDSRTVAGVVGLFSGGNDSTQLMHLFRTRLTHAGHANTGVGVEETRQYVRDTCAAWGIPLLERSATRERDTYRHHVLTYGFPGPGKHMKMYQRLKERALEQMQRELVGNPFRQRVVFVAGRRRTESTRRANVPELQRKGSAVYVSPLVNWTKADLNTYRLVHGDVPRNEVSDLIHMSGECLCGCFAHAGERDEVSGWFPAAFDDIAGMEEVLAGYATDFIPPGATRPIPEHARKWGWGGDPKKLAASREKPSRSGLLCSSCEARHDSAMQLDIFSSAVGTPAHA